MSDYPMLISNKLHSFRNFSMQSYVLLSEHKDKEESFHHRKNISPKNMQKNRLNIRIFSHISISENIFYEEKYFKTYFF